MKTIQIPMQKSIEKYVPKAKGVGQNVITGAGFGRVARSLDKIALKGLLDSFGGTIPIVKVRVSVIDAINFAIHNHGINLKKEGFIAVGADRALEVGLNFDKIKIPTSFDDVLSQTGEL